MVDDGRKIYQQRHATDAETGRTISTPDLDSRWADSEVHPGWLALAVVVAALIVVGFVVAGDVWGAG